MDEKKEKWYTVKQASEITRLSQWVISTACKKGELEAGQISDSSKAGFHYTISESKLNAWLAVKKAAVTEPMGIETISAMLSRMLKDEYERGFKAGKEEARRAFNDAMRGL